MLYQQLSSMGFAYPDVSLRRMTVNYKFFRVWRRAAVGTAFFHSVFSCLDLLGVPIAETYCWPNITWRSLLSTAASGACHSLETLQWWITRQR